MGHVPPIQFLATAQGKENAGHAPNAALLALAKGE